jgi:hypothetical protein
VQGRHPEQISDALGAAGAQIGPRANSLATWLHYALGFEFAKIATLLERLGVAVTAGAICSAAQSNRYRSGPGPGRDDRADQQRADGRDGRNGWRVGGESAWLWAATTKDATAYKVADGRGFEQATVFVDDDYAGTVVRDGWAVYRQYSKATHQTCTAHLLRRWRK